MAIDKVIAVHEAGHVVLSIHSGLGVASATIDRDKDSDGGIYYTRSSFWLVPYFDGKRPPLLVAPSRRAFVMAHLLSCWGGYAAEGLTFGKPSLTWRRSWDEHHAGICAKLLGCADVRAVVASFREPAEAILEAKRGELEALTDALVRHRTLTGVDIRRILARHRAFVRAQWDVARERARHANGRSS